MSRDESLLEAAKREIEMLKIDSQVAHFFANPVAPFRRLTSDYKEAPYAGA